MKAEPPCFELKRVYVDGTEDLPEIVPVGQTRWQTEMGRRGFLGVGVGAAAVLLISSSGCVLSHKAHEGAVQSLALTPDGKLLASGSLDGKIKLWSVPERKLTLVLVPKTDRQTNTPAIKSLAISPDGKILVSAAQREATIWSLPDGRQLSALQAANDITALAISPNSATLISASDTSTTPYNRENIKLWSLSDGLAGASIQSPDDHFLALAISRDGKVLASGSRNKTIKLWSIPDGKPLLTFNAGNEGHSDSIGVLAVHPDGASLISGSSDRTIKIWSMPEGRIIRTLRGHSEIVDALALTPDGRILASGSWDKTIKLWSIPDGQLVSTLTGHEGFVASVVISPDGKTLISGGYDRQITLWNLDDRKVIAHLHDPKVRQSDSTPEKPVDTCPSHSGGGFCQCNKVCTCIPVPSDRNLKEAFQTVDPLVILEHLSELPIQIWNSADNCASPRRIGPKARDFAALFGVGVENKHIQPVDAHGVALAAIQGLYQLLKKRDAETKSLRAQLQQLEAEHEFLDQRIAALEGLVDSAIA